MVQCVCSVLGYDADRVHPENVGEFSPQHSRHSCAEYVPRCVQVLDNEDEHLALRDGNAFLSNHVRELSVDGLYQGKVCQEGLCRRILQTDGALHLLPRLLHLPYCRSDVPFIQMFHVSLSLQDSVVNKPNFLVLPSHDSFSEPFEVAYNNVGLLEFFLVLMVDEFYPLYSVFHLRVLYSFDTKVIKKALTEHEIHHFFVGYVYLGKVFLFIPVLSKGG